MSRILFAWELGANLGHLSRDIPIANALRKDGHAVHFAVRDTRVANEMLAPHGLGFVQAPVCHGRTRLAQAPANYAELLVAEGWCDRKALHGLIAAWVELMAWGQFDVVVADHAPGALVAARLTGRAAIPFGSGFEIPPNIEPMPSIRPWENFSRERLLASEHRLLAGINAVVSELHGQPYERLADLFGANPVLACCEELDHYGPRPGARYVGPICGLPDAVEVPWPDTKKPRVLAYLRQHHAATPEVMAALAASDVCALCVIPGADAAFKAQYANENLWVFEHPVAMAPLLDQADIMVTYGGIGTVTAALRQGVPLLVLPATVENYLCGKRVEALQAGVLMDAEIKKGGIVEHLLALLSDSRWRDAAKVLAAKMERAELGKTIAVTAEHVVRQMVLQSLRA